jgi:hypothetical protein
MNEDLGKESILNFAYQELLKRIPNTLDVPSIEELNEFYEDFESIRKRPPTLSEIIDTFTSGHLKRILKDFPSRRTNQKSKN